MSNFYIQNEPTLNFFYGIKTHDEKAYAKMLKRVEAIKSAMGSTYVLHVTNHKTKQ